MIKELEKSIKWLSNVNNFENVSRYSKEYFEHFNKIVKALTELKELKIDVKRYFELEGNYRKTLHEYHEMEYIKSKLLEVGVNNE